MAFINVSPWDSLVTYLWDVNAGNQTTDTAFNLSAGTYQVVITDSIGCKDSATITVSQPSSITVIDNYVNPTCNGGGDGTIFVSAMGGTTPYSYSWGSNQLVGLIAGTYPLIITDSNNCVYTDTFTLVDPPPMTLIFDTISSSCGLSDGLITALVQGGNPNYIYNWLPGGFGNDTLSNVSSGLYTLTVTDVNGCAVTDSIFLDEVKGYEVDFTLYPSLGIAPLTVSFSNLSTNCVSYYWDFGNGNTSIFTNPLDEIYPLQGEYDVMLVGCNSSGLARCCDTTFQTVVVENSSHCSWINVVTPNGDNVNDRFDLNCEQLRDFHIVIFNRWGNKIFETDDVSKSWDGTRNGKDVPAGTYFFIVDAVGLDDVEWRKQGSFTLIR